MLFNILKDLVSPELIEQSKNGCPIPGPLNISGFELQKIEKYLPSVLPEGSFKEMVRFYNKATNHTIVDIELIFEIKPIGLSDTIKMG